NIGTDIGFDYTKRTSHGTGATANAEHIHPLYHATF
ncbi:unnamed protein product, partial [marine sediment metagenome]